MFRTAKQLMEQVLHNPVLANGPAVRVFFDGACEPRNPGGVATCGWIIYGTDDNVIHEGSEFICEGDGATNNVAEYNALGRALRWLVDHDEGLDVDGQINIFGDSRLVCEQVAGNWACNKEHLRKLRDRCRELIQDLQRNYVVTLRWIPREENELADSLSRTAYERHTGRRFPERRYR